MGVQTAPIHLPLASDSSLIPSFSRAMSCPRVGFPGSPDYEVPSLQGRPLATSTWLPAQQQGKKDSRECLHPARSSGSAPFVLLGLCICGKWDKEYCWGLPGSPRAWPPQLQPQTMGPFPSWTSGTQGKGSQCWPWVSCPSVLLCPDLASWPQYPGLVRLRTRLYLWPPQDLASELGSPFR